MHGRLDLALYCYFYAERLWNAISQSQRNLQMFDDQVAINNAFYDCDVKWSNTTNSQAMIGECAESEEKLLGLRITILPTNVICRKCFKKHKSRVYVWHKQSKKNGEAKMKAATSTDTWFLKNITMVAERNQEENLKGIRWIRAIAKLEDIK